jgi:hypothetical protein
VKIKAIPLKFSSVIEEEYEKQLGIIRQMFADEVEFLQSLQVGEVIPDEAQVVVFPVLVGEAYSKLDFLQTIKLPIVIITSPFGTMAMWDWEIITVFKDLGMNVFAPYNPELARVVFRSISVKKEMKTAKFLIFQDTPGDGMQADIFKRFYWWEQKCTQSLMDKFGIEIIIKSYKDIGEKAKKISDSIALETAKQHKVSSCSLSSERKLLSAYKLFVAINEEIQNISNLKGVGANCLNESFLSDTTPCLAWNLLYKNYGIVWSCEGDTMSLLTQYMIEKAIKVPVVTTNIYPFLMGMAALAHEKITEFPNVPDPDDHALLVHCGYFGLVPEDMAQRWELKDKVLGIVDENAHVIDAEIGTGKITLAKIHSSFEKLFVCDAELEKYVQYPGSDCRNGGLIRVNDGHKVMEKLYSHHVSVVKGNKKDELKTMCRIFDLDLDDIR